MALTLAQLRNQTQRRLSDTRARIWGKTELTAYIQQGYDQLTALTRMLFVRTRLADIATVATYQMPGDFQSFERASWNGALISPLPVRYLSRSDPSFLTLTGDVDGYTFELDGPSVLRKWRVPVVNGSGERDTFIEYYRRGLPLDSDSVELEILDHYTVAIRHFVLWKAYNRQGTGHEPTLARHFKGLYENFLKRLHDRRRATDSIRIAIVGQHASDLAESGPPLARPPSNFPDPRF